MRRHILTAVSLMAYFLCPANADDKRPEPHVVVQAQPLAVWLLDLQAISAKYPPALTKALTSGTDSGTFKDILAAINKTKRFGLYVNFPGKIEDTEFVALLPLKDEKAFWKLVEGLGGKVQEKNGLHEVTFPPQSETWYVRLRDDYANVARHADSLSDAKLL